MKEDFIPILLGSDINVYGMASSFYELYQKKSIIICKKVLTACSNSDLIQVGVIEPNLENDEVFVKTLINFKKNYKNTNLLLVPCGDNYLRLVVRNQDKIKKYYKFNCISKKLFNILDTKEKFYKLCEKNNFDYPKTMILTKKNYLKKKIDFNFPIVIKPSNSVMYWNTQYNGKRKVYIVENLEEANNIINTIYNSSYTDNLIVQEFIPGDDTSMRVVNCYCDKFGKVTLVALGHVLLEEYTPEGIGSYATIISYYDKEIMDSIITFLEKIKFKGYANFDIKYDKRDGKYKLFEINPRQGRSSYFVTAAGYNITKYLVDDIIYNKTRNLDVVKNSIIYSIVPKSIIFKYVMNKEMKEQAKFLIKEHKFYNSYISKYDKNIKRISQFIENQLHYYSKYAKYFKDKNSFK